MPTQSLAQRCSELLQLGLAHHHANRLDEAEACYRKILRQESQHPDALNLLGVIAQQRGQYDAAVQLIRAAIQQHPAAADYHNNLANTFRLQGNPSAAVASYREAIELDRDHVDALHSLANLLAEQNQFAEAEACFQRVLAMQPGFGDAWYNFGNAKWQAGNLQAAIACYRRAIKLNAGRAEFHFNLARGLQDSGALAEAAAVFREVLALTPQDAEAHHHLGVVLQEQDDFRRAAEAFRRALTLQPNFPEALCNLASNLQHDEDFASAESLLRKAIALNPALAEAHSNLGGNFWRQGNLSGAIDACRRAIDLNPNLPEAHSNLGHALSDDGDLDEAMRSYHRALALKPDTPKFLHYIGLVHLLRGEFSTGWPLYENRWQTKALAKAQRNFAQPLWRGEPLNGSRILLHAEQGLGDTLQFVRYVPLVAERGARVVLEVPAELRSVLTGVSGVAEIVTRGQSLPDFDWHCPLLSLPLAFHTDLNTIPANIPYLHANPDAARTHSQHLARIGLRVGLVWAGNAIHTRDPQRSIALAQLVSLTEIAGIHLYSLQKGPAASQLQELPPSIDITDCGSELTDFADTATLLSSLDLLISVDTATAHLAGALGKPVWILLTHTPDWRWLLDRTDSPWYPTARLFRQPVPGDWSSVIVQVAGELQHLVNRSSSAALQKNTNSSTRL